MAKKAKASGPQLIQIRLPLIDNGDGTYSITTDPAQADLTIELPYVVGTT